MIYPPDSSNIVRAETWSYDTAGRLYHYKTPYGWIKTFTYDSRHRQTIADWDTASGQDVTTNYDAASRVTSIVSGPTTVAFPTTMPIIKCQKHKA